MCFELRNEILKTNKYKMSLFTKAKNPGFLRKITSSIGLLGLVALAVVIGIKFKKPITDQAVNLASKVGAGDTVTSLLS